jgi:hypothetical protein
MGQDNKSEAINTVVSSKPQQQEFAAWIENCDAPGDTQARAKLDYVLPEDLVLPALADADVFLV